jgi:hypothetical protein
VNVVAALGIHDLFDKLSRFQSGYSTSFIMSTNYRRPPMLIHRISGYSALMLFASLFSADADVFLKQKHHTDAYTIMNQEMPATDKVVSIWYTKDKARMDQTADTSIIFRLDKKTMTLLCHRTKTYTEMPLADISSMMANAMGEDDEMDAEAKSQAAAMMQQMAAMMKPTVTVKETADTKKIKNWNTRKYLLTTSIAGVTANSEVWACPDIKADYAFYNKLMNVYVAKMPGAEAVTKEIEKIKGFMVLLTSSSNVMGATVNMVQELLEIKENAAPPAGGYEVPAGYKKSGK